MPPAVPLSVSISYLGIVLRQETGKTFVEYLTDLRMEKAKHLLQYTDKKNYEISELCGYSTPAYFSTVFKSATGLTPSEYRKSFHEKNHTVS